MMRLIVMGQQAFGQSVFERLMLSKQDEVVSVYCAPDQEGRLIDSLKQAALTAGVTVRQPGNFKSEDVLSQMQSDKADLLIMAYVTLFVPQAVRDIPSKGAICFHPSLLPLHRGPSSINWPIIGGATKTGFSWFYPTDGLDEGDILYQEECIIGPDDTLSDVYFKKIFPVAVKSIDKVCDLFRRGNPPRTVQVDRQATYQSWCRKSDVEIDWTQPVANVYNLIRGSNPQPGAWTVYGGKTVQIYDSERLDGKGEEAGCVIQIDDDGIVIQARGGQIKIKRVRPAGAGKISAVQWAHEIDIGPGACFGNQT